jgi:hypothetical protein
LELGTCQVEVGHFVMHREVYFPVRVQLSLVQVCLDNQFVIRGKRIPELLEYWFISA